MSTSDRAFGVLKLFTLEKPSWTADEIAGAMGVSPATGYRFIRALEEAGLIAPTGAGVYTLGPAIIQLDRQIQLTDPLLAAAAPVMEDLRKYGPEGSAVLLCRSFGETVLCMRQVFTAGPQPLVSYERGRPMPLFAGATSKVILAYQPARWLRTLYENHRDEVSVAGLGKTLEEFRNSLANIRKAGYAITSGEIDRGRIGIAAAILNQDRRAVGSLSYVVSGEVEMRACQRLATIAQSGAQEIEATLNAHDKSSPGEERLPPDRGEPGSKAAEPSTRALLSQD
ncbi:helix-turn-helix domain-containing protein [Paraburkholderia panacisoli]|uniref:Helix-turn-helix domain-containing protein n=1 Tax=Paraburkholderia panacisoli TaxID=2603818 RepID=A0A5B0G5W7_9BURK|nr:IclR family transcriptional regulator C-terminal domain-containing protein [Paraburkholderia panacisoli]KAA0998817.1 helix-turn-helix domain-containing protein [Paraburkholderia panacisoli]